MAIPQEKILLWDAHPTKKYSGRMPISQEKILLWNGRHKGIIGQARCPSHNKKYSCGMGILPVRDICTSCIIVKSNYAESGQEISLG